MPTFQITGPDGKKYRISGETAEGAVQALQKHLGDSDPRDSILGKADSFMRGAADTLSFGLADEIAAGLGTGFGTLGDYDEELARQRGIDEADYSDRFGYRLGGQVSGGLTGGVGLAKNGLSMTAKAADSGASLGRVAAASAADSTILGAGQGFGSGEGLGDRLYKSGVGGLTGLALGAATPFAVAGAQKGLGAAAAPVMARIFPERYAQTAIGDTVRRSGMSVDDVAAALGKATDDGQDMYNVADALGLAGRRALTPVTKTPNDARQQVVEALQTRQVGQSDRLSNFLAEGFDATDTAAQREASLLAQRSASANTNYGAARDSAGTIDPSRAIAAADEFLGVGGSLSRTNIADDSIESAVSRAKSYLTDGESVLTDFNSALRSKQELDAMIEGAKPAVQRQLIPIRNALDDALSDASAPYANARDTFRQQSKAIEAVDTGRSAASGRMRSSDTIPRFNAMQPEEQAAYRAGYVDPYIARIEATSMAPTTNKARGLITPKTQEEFPAFAAPGRAEQMGERIAREQRMFETSNAALGGSATMENFADAAEMAKFDPAVLSKLFRGDIIGSVVDGAKLVGKEATGMQPRVVEQIAKVLMETNPQVAKSLLTEGSSRLSKSDQLRAKVISALIGSGAAGTGRLPAP